jgi:GTP-binding protein HflX
VVLEADLLVHVVDGAGPDPDGCMAAVREVIREIGGGAVEELVVFNKLDRTAEVKRLSEEHPGSVAISARSGEGVRELLLRVGDRLRSRTPKVVLEVPWDRGDVVAALHRHGEVLKEEAGDSGMRVTARLSQQEASRWAEFLQ